MVSNEYMKVVHEKICHKIVKKMEKIADQEGDFSSQDLDNLKDGAKVLWYMKECTK